MDQPLFSASRTCIARIVVALSCMMAVLLTSMPARAVTAIDVGKEQDRIDINALGTSIKNIGDQLQLETAAGIDGLTDRMSVSAAARGSNPPWFTFALRNVSDTRVERWLIADRYSQSGSGIIWPRLDARQIENVTPSIGFLPENLALDGTDAYRLTVEPGQTVTFVVELFGDATPRLTVWRALDYEKRARNKQLLYGVLLGITGLLAVFLSALFAANHKIIFPAAALFTWCVLAYLCVDFGFWHKLFAVRPEDNAQYRAATEAGVAATLLIFTNNFLRLGAWNGFARLLLRLWIVGQLGLVAIAFLDPRLAATFARLSMGGIFALCTVFVVLLALRGQDRALSLVPVWMLLGVWITGMAFVFIARLQTDATVTALVSGLVLIVLLIGFTVTQYAFRSAEPAHSFGSGDQGIRLLALENSGAALWEWNAKRDDIVVGSNIEAALGIAAGDLTAPAQVFLDRMHPVDRDRLRQALDHLKESGSGDLHLEFRMRHVDNDYRWFVLEAATDPTSERRRVRCVGLVRETTDSHSAHERFIHDAVHDSVTNLPNRALFLDRLGVAVTRSKSEPLIQPAVIVIDVDRYKAVGATTQHFEADGLLITIARRLSHLIGPTETLARIGSDQFGILLLAQRPTRELHMLADSLRISVRSVIKVGGVEITPTAAIGYAVYDRTTGTAAADVLDDAEIAMHRARRQGRDAVLAFTPDLRIDRRDRSLLEADLRQAIEKRQLTLQYQPIYVMRTQQIAGYEALVRWEHPRLGKVDPAEFVPLAEESDLILALGSAVISMAVADLQRWHAVYDRVEAPLTVSVNVSRRQMFDRALVTKIRKIIDSARLPRGCLRLEVTETLVMENPENAANVLGELVAAGAGLSLDDFGTGYSSLTYLNTFPFDTIKIDRALVQGSSDAGSVSAILRSVIALAHELGKKVVAEGIEIDEDASALRALGCEYAQGPFYDQPQSPKDVIQVLKELRKAERRTKRGSLFLLKERRSGTSQPSVPARTGDAAAAPNASSTPATTKPPALPGSKVASARAASKTAAPSKLAASARMTQRRPLSSAAAAGEPIRATAVTAVGAHANATPMSGTHGAPPYQPARPPMPQTGSHAPPRSADPVPADNRAALAANASLAELGAQMARAATPPSAPRTQAPQPPRPSAPAQMPASILNALSKPFAAMTAPPAVGPNAVADPDTAQPPARPPAASPAVAPRPDFTMLPPRPALAPLDLSSLPPGIAASLARLAGQSAEPRPARVDADGTESANTADPLARFIRPPTDR